MAKRNTSSVAPQTTEKKRSPRTKGTESSVVRAEIDAGICGFLTSVEAQGYDMREVKLAISSDCPQIAKAAEQLESVDILEEFRAGLGQGHVYTVLRGCVRHATCPVGSGILKAAEAAAGLALPRNAYIRVTVEGADENAEDANDDAEAGDSSQAD